MTGGRQDTGRLGEALAARYLEAAGYRVLQRNYRCAIGELDLIVEGADGLVFVEVRTRRQPSLIQPEETVKRPKAVRLIRLAEWYLVNTGRDDTPWRIDLIAIELSARGELVRIERIQDAVAGVAGDGF